MQSVPQLFKSEDAQAHYNAAYDAILEIWPTQYQELNVPSRLGSTHILVSGPAEAIPLVLLHGFGVNATM